MREPVRSSMGCAKCEPSVGKKPQEGVLLFFLKIPFRKQGMHAIAFCSALREPDDISCVGFSVSVTHTFTKHVKNFSALASPRETAPLSKFQKRSWLMSYQRKHCAFLLHTSSVPHKIFCGLTLLNWSFLFFFFKVSKYTGVLQVK